MPVPEVQADRTAGSEFGRAPVPEVQADRTAGSEFGRAPVPEAQADRTAGSEFGRAPVPEARVDRTAGLEFGRARCRRRGRTEQRDRSSTGAGAGGAGGPGSGVGVLPGAGAGARADRLVALEFCRVLERAARADRLVESAYGPAWARATRGLRRPTGLGSRSVPIMHRLRRWPTGSRLPRRAVGYPAYSSAMLASHPNAWVPTDVVTASLYKHPGYSNLAVGLGLAAQPVPYDYGGNVVVQPHAVYVNGDTAGTPQEYASQASQLAGTGQSAQPAPDTKWLPLGVFAVVEGNQTSSDDIFQLAVDRQGIIRGNYHNLRSDQVETISGAVDKSTQCVAWTIGSDQYPVYEAGIANLTQDETPILVHTGEGQTRQMSLIRLPPPSS